MPWSIFQACDGRTVVVNRAEGLLRCCRRAATAESGWASWTKRILLVTPLREPITGDPAKGKIGLAKDLVTFKPNVGATGRKWD